MSSLKSVRPADYSTPSSQPCGGQFSPPMLSSCNPRKAMTSAESIMTLKTDQMVVTMLLIVARNPNHHFTLIWGACQPDQPTVCRG